MPPLPCRTAKQCWQECQLIQSFTEGNVEEHDLVTQQSPFKEFALEIDLKEFKNTYAGGWKPPKCPPWESGWTDWNTHKECVDLRRIEEKVTD